MMTNPDPASAVASAAIAAAAAGPLSKLVLGNQRQVQQSILVEITKTNIGTWQSKRSPTIGGLPKQKPPD